MREDCNKHPNVKVKVVVAVAGKNFEFALDTFQKRGLFRGQIGSMKGPAAHIRNQIGPAAQF